MAVFPPKKTFPKRATDALNPVTNLPFKYSESHVIIESYVFFSVFFQVVTSSQ